MFFKAVFSHWINDYEPAIIGPVSPEALWDYEFLIEAESASEAEQIARKYEGIETHSYEGIGDLKEIRTANPDEIEQLQPITIYADYLPEERARKARIAMLEVKLFEILEDMAQEYGMSPEEAKFITIGMVSAIEKMIKSGK